MPPRAAHRLESMRLGGPPAPVHYLSLRGSPAGKLLSKPGRVLLGLLAWQRLGKQVSLIGLGAPQSARPVHHRRQMRLVHDRLIDEGSLRAVFGQAKTRLLAPERALLLLPFILFCSVLFFHFKHLNVALQIQVSVCFKQAFQTIIIIL